MGVYASIPVGSALGVAVGAEDDDLALLGALRLYKRSLLCQRHTCHRYIREAYYGRDTCVTGPVSGTPTI